MTEQPQVVDSQSTTYHEATCDVMGEESVIKQKAPVDGQRQGQGLGRDAGLLLPGRTDHVHSDLSLHLLYGIMICVSG